MASLLFTTGGAMIKALGFSGTNFFLGMLTDHGKEEYKRHYLALERLQRARDEYNNINMEYSSAMFMKQCLNTIKYLKKIQPLSSEPQLSNFYHLSEAPQKW